MNWEVLFYITSSGQPVVQKFIETLPKIPHAKLLKELDLLEKYGTELGMPHTKPIGAGLIELRARGKQEVRVLYVFAKERRIYLLHGFIKKTQTTPKKELDIALQRKKEIENL
ncbi:MAG TPA: type II toxin-antitoxin system RelE/ParE family toxin [Candidatus Limnocylindria bacterium]|nr:type II toxin-antitoxin system RelE/ParE family toxin [Candidatus Limnocylindria bacterium]